MKNSEIRQMTDKELKERLEEEKLRLVKMKMNHVISPLENPNQIPALRKDIARLMSDIRRREIEKLKNNVSNGK